MGVGRYRLLASGVHPAMLLVAPLLLLLPHSSLGHGFHAGPHFTNLYYGYTEAELGQYLALTAAEPGVMIGIAGSTALYVGLVLQRSGRWAGTPATAGCPSPARSLPPAPAMTACAARPA